LIILSTIILIGSSSCQKNSADPGKSGLYAVFQTSMGEIKCRLFENESPVTVKNFTELATGQKQWKIPYTETWVSKPLYDGTIFHRVIPGFMIQGGDPVGNGTGGPGYRFNDEFNPSLKFNKPGLLAMANSGRNTNGSQFFITDGETPWLDGKHTIFGECGNMDVVKAIAGVEKGLRDRPKKDVVITHLMICRGENPCVEVKPTIK